MPRRPRRTNARVRLETSVRQAEQRHRMPRCQGGPRHARMQRGIACSSAHHWRPAYRQNRITPHREEPPAPATQHSTRHALRPDTTLLYRNCNIPASASSVELYTLARTIGLPSSARRRYGSRFLSLHSAASRCTHRLALSDNAVMGAGRLPGGIAGSAVQSPQRRPREVARITRGGIAEVARITRDVGASTARRQQDRRCFAVSTRSHVVTPVAARVIKIAARVPQQTSSSLAIRVASGSVQCMNWRQGARRASVDPPIEGSSFRRCGGWRLTEPTRGPFGTAPLLQRGGNGGSRVGYGRAGTDGRNVRAGIFAVTRDCERCSS